MINWDAIGAIGEGVGAAGVVITLLYLARQIRAQNQESRLAAMHDVFLGFRETALPFGSNEMVEVFFRCNSNIDKADDKDMFRLIVATHGILRVWEEAYYLHADGRLADRIWNSVDQTYSHLMSAPAMAHVWKARGRFYPEEFRNYVDNLGRSQYSVR